MHNRDGQARARLCPIRGLKGCAALIGIGEATEFLILRESYLVAWQLTDSACRLVKGVESARGTFYRNCPGSSQSGTAGSADDIVG